MWIKFKTNWTKWRPKLTINRKWRRHNLNLTIFPCLVSDRRYELIINYFKNNLPGLRSFNFSAFSTASSVLLFMTVWWWNNDKTQSGSGFVDLVCRVPQLDYHTTVACTAVIVSLSFWWQWNNSGNGIVAQNIEHYYLVSIWTYHFLCTPPSHRRSERIIMAVATGTVLYPLWETLQLWYRIFSRKPLEYGTVSVALYTTDMEPYL